MFPRQMMLVYGVQLNQLEVLEFMYAQLSINNTWNIEESKIEELKRIIELTKNNTSYSEMNEEDKKSMYNIDNYIYFDGSYLNNFRLGYLHHNHEVDGFTKDSYYVGHLLLDYMKTGVQSKDINTINDIIPYVNIRKVKETISKFTDKEPKLMVIPSDCQCCS